MTFLTRLFFLAAMISGMTPPMEMPARVTLGEIELVEKALDRLDEQLGAVIGLRDVGEAVARIIERVDGEGFLEQRHQLLEDIELGPERVQQDEVGSAAGLDITDAIAVNVDVADGNLGGPIELLGGLGRNAQGLGNETCAEDANENDDDYQHKHRHRVLQDAKGREERAWTAAAPGSSPSNR